MSRRRTCCCGGGEGDVCFKFAVTAQQLQYCTLACSAVTCTIYDLLPGCPETSSFGVINTYTRALGTLQPQQFVAGRIAECSCGIPCVYTWTPPEVSWDTSICFKMNGLGSQCFGCPEIIDQYPPAGDLNNKINVIIGGPLLCPQVCSCCGTNTRFVSIEYSRVVPMVTIQGECGSVTIGTFGNAWFTTYTAQYCWQPSNPCVMTLFRIFASSNTYFAPSYGPDAFTGGECDCGNNSNNGCDTSTTGSNCYPCTGDWATIYAAAGSPPATLTCGSCKC